MSKASDDPLLDLHHQEIVEQEERIRAEYPVLKKQVADLKVAYDTATKRIQSLTLEIEGYKNDLKASRSKVEGLLDELQELREQLREAKAAPKPSPEVPMDERKPFKFKKGTCRDCNAPILWGLTKNKKFVPLQTEGVVGEMINWTKDLEAELAARGIKTRQGYDEMGERTTVAIVKDPDPSLAKKIFPTHFQYCGRNPDAQNLSSPGPVLHDHAGSAAVDEPVRLSGTGPGAEGRQGDQERQE